MIVMKFGGSSVANAENIIKVVNIIQEKKEAKVVVFSAMSGITDALENVWQSYQNKDVIDAQCCLIKQVFMNLISELLSDNRVKLICKALVNYSIENVIKLERANSLKRANVVSLGEKLTSFIIHQYCQELGMNTELIDAEKLIRKNSNNEVNQKFITENCSHLLTNRKPSSIYITQGFVCSTEGGQTSVLGRGGSDYSATLIGCAIKAIAIEIWSDTNGVLNNDPRKVRNTYTIDALSYDEATEMAFFGAKILHPKCLIPAKEHGVRVIVKNTFNPEFPGTLISSRTTHTTVVKAAATKENISILNIKSNRTLSENGFVSKTFKTLSKYQLQTNLMSITDATIAIAIIENSQIETCINQLSKFSSVSVLKEQSIITLVGNLSSNSSGNSDTILKPFKKIAIKMIGYGSSNTSISIVINKADQNRALQNVNEYVFNLKN
jgi:aspartate kinase